MLPLELSRRFVSFFYNPASAEGAALARRLEAAGYVAEVAAPQEARNARVFVSSSAQEAEAEPPPATHAISDTTEGRRNSASGGQTA